MKTPGTQPSKQTKLQSEDKENTSSAQWVSPNEHVYENAEMELNKNGIECL